MTHPLIGRTLGKYSILSLIASGGMANVLLAEDNYLKRRVAIKVMMQGYDRHEKLLFEEEAARIAQLEHEHILPLLEFDYIGSQETFPYMVMPVAKCNLHSVTTGRVLSLNQALSYAHPIAQALFYAHTKHHVVHCDVKPQNVLLDTSNKLLLSDFGIAVVSRSINPKRQAASGTLPYMAPEQFLGASVSATDQYALAIMLYEFLTGRYPYILPQGSKQQAYFIAHHTAEMESFPGSLSYLDEVFRKALAKKPEERFLSVTDFVKAIDAAKQQLNMQTAKISHPDVSEKVRQPVGYKSPLPSTKSRNESVPTSAQDWFKKGNKLDDLGKYQEAIEAFDEAIRINPDYAQAYNNKGAALNKLCKFQEAVTAFDQAIRINPDYTNARNNKGLVIKTLVTLALIKQQRLSDK